MYVDIHVHCFELQEDLSRYVDEIKLVCVSDDIESSFTTLTIWERYRNVEPCIGVHPWVAHEYSVHDIKNMLNQVIGNYDIKCLGEVGLDKKFKLNTFDKQLEVFLTFVEYAKEYDLVMNIHAADAWRDVLEIVRSRGISRVVFHWFTGPLDVLEEIENSGYFVGANPAWIIQEKHRTVLEHAKLNSIITESDAPYNYRGLKMLPHMVKTTIEYIAKTRGLNVDYVKKVVYNNYLRLFG